MDKNVNVLKKLKGIRTAPFSRRKDPEKKHEKGEMTDF